MFKNDLKLNNKHAFKSKCMRKLNNKSSVYYSLDDIYGLITLGGGNKKDAIELILSYISVYRIPGKKVKLTW